MTIFVHDRVQWISFPQTINDELDLFQNTIVFWCPLESCERISGQEMNCRLPHTGRGTILAVN